MTTTPKELNDYEPFGKEWREEMGKFNKGELIDKLKSALRPTHKDSLTVDEKLIERVQKSLTGAKLVIDVVDRLKELSAGNDTNLDVIVKQQRTMSSLRKEASELKAKLETSETRIEEAYKIVRSLEADVERLTKSDNARYKQLMSNDNSKQIHDINNLRQYLVGIREGIFTVDETDEALVKMIDKLKGEPNV